MIGVQCIAAGLSITAIEAAKADSSDRRNDDLLAQQRMMLVPQPGQA